MRFALRFPGPWAPAETHKWLQQQQLMRPEVDSISQLPGRDSVVTGTVRGVSSTRPWNRAFLEFEEFGLHFQHLLSECSG
jgi:hypothetical protein